MFKRSVLAAAAMLALSSPATAATVLIDFGTGGPTGTAASYSTTVGGITADVTGHSYGTQSPTGLTTLAGMSSALISFSANGIGVCTEGGSTSANSGECPQVDTNGSPNEGLLFDFSGPGSGYQYNLIGAVLNIVDGNDTIGVYGVLGDSLSFLGFVGQNIATGGSGFTSTPAGTNQYSITFTPTLGRFDGYFFTSTNDSADGYRVRSVTIAAVPEPEVWAMLILGFAMIGLQMRRRGRLMTVTA